ncbi:MAG: ferritin family protein [candidate division WOR-3 bacterium]
MSTNEAILNGLKEAMVAERTGIEFYRTAAERTRDEQGKAVFLRLAADEQKHLEYLQEQYRHLLKNTVSPVKLELPVTDTTGASPIFSPELKARINQAHWEMTALSVGLALEQASIARYRQLAAEAEGAELRRFFESLVRWEESHAAALQQQFNLLREDYWREAGFAPF